MNKSVPTLDKSLELLKKIIKKPEVTVETPPVANTGSIADNKPQEPLKQGA